MIASAVGKRIAIAPLTGDPEIAGPLHAAMLRERPRDAGREVDAIDAAVLESNQQIRLASATSGETSDIALLNLARRSGVDFVLHGEIVPPRDALRHHVRARQDPLRSPLPGDPADPAKADLVSLAEQQAREESLLKVSWNLIDVSGSTPLSGQPVVTRRELAQSDAAVITAAAAAAWELVIPHVIDDQAQLAAPRLSLAGRAIARGNEAASRGDWQRAEQSWQQVLQRYPQQHAAMHNLAIAAVARQDFAQARRLIAQALQARNLSLYQKTAVWIEQRQRDYHLAFALPDPPEGWAATSR